MDVCVLLTVVVVLAGSRHVSTQNAVDAANSTVSPSEPVTACLTARNVSGVCVQRNICDYSAGPIDLTLYAYHAYQRTVVVVLAGSRHVSTQNAVDAANSTVSPSEPVTACLTARNVSGVCVQRNICDYSAGPIDLTLYAYHAYQRPCTIAEVCCPPAAIVHVEPAKPDTSDSDEDDM